MFEQELYYLFIILASLIGLLLGGLLIWLSSKAKQNRLEERQAQQSEKIDDLKAQLHQLNEDREKVRLEKEQLLTDLTKKNADLLYLQRENEKRDEDIEERQTQLRREFTLLANSILEEKSNKFTEQNKENIKNILNPLEEKIRHFEKKVEDSQKENITMHTALREQLLGLKDLNLKMTQEATNLTKALKGDSKMQGNWGELVLERVLEKSGLEKDREYFVQQSFTLEDGSRSLPDVVIHLPDGKKMIIDAKVSLTDYERLVNADREDEPAYLKAHVNSIKRHVDQLSSKNYQDLYDIESPDFVLMFVPIEPAFATAINEDNSLYNKAFEQNIVIVTPSTLLATLRTIDTMWNNEKQQRNAIEIARQAGALYDKFEGLVTDLTGIGRQLDTTKNTYAKAMNKLVEGNGNLISRVQKLKTMGAKAKKSLPESFLKRAEEDDLNLDQ